MDSFALQFANGNSFFVGIGLTVVAASIPLWGSSRFFVLGDLTLWVCGVCLVILSASPLPLWLYGLWVALCLAMLLARRRRFLRLVTAGITAAFAVTSTILCFLEIPYHRTPCFSLFPNEPVFVLGDSISAGINPTKEVLWPSILASISHLKVTNLAKPGATTESVLQQLSGITNSNALVIVEIGGNDLLEGTDSSLFFIQLEKLLYELKCKHAHTVMFELPLVPFHNGFGKAQRLLAKKYGVTLIPKDCLTRVLGLKGATIDGLHLSEIGHNALAKSIFNMMKMNESS